MPGVEVGVAFDMVEKIMAATGATENCTGPSARCCLPTGAGAKVVQI